MLLLLLLLLLLQVMSLGQHTLPYTPVVLNLLA
jgi:hypothetical protein